VKLVFPCSGIGYLHHNEHQKPFEILNSVTPGAQKGGNAGKPTLSSRVVSRNTNPGVAKSRNLCALVARELLPGANSTFCALLSYAERYQELSVLENASVARWATPCLRFAGKLFYPTQPSHSNKVWIFLDNATTMCCNILHHAGAEILNRSRVGCFANREERR